MIEDITIRALYKSNSHPKGAYEASYSIGEGRRKTKQSSLHVNEPKIAFETVELWAEDKAKELGYNFIRTSKAELDEVIATGSSRKYTTRTDALANASKLSKLTLNNKNIFRAEIKKAFDEVSAERIQSVINDGLFLLEQLQNERLKLEEDSLKGKRAIAEAMYKLFTDSNIDMSASISDDKVLQMYNKLRDG